MKALTRVGVDFMRRYSISPGLSAGILVLFLLLAVVQGAWCVKIELGKEGRIHVGPLRIHPGVVISETYTDNYFLEPDDERWEWITTISPNLTIHLPLRRHSVEFEYRSDFGENYRHNEYNADHHFLKGIFNLNFPGGLAINVGHLWVADSNPPIFNGDDRKRYKDNVSFLSAGYRFSDRYSVGVVYRHHFRRFNRGPFDADDHDKDDVALDLNYRILPKTTVFLESGYTNTRYPERDLISYDNDEYRVWLGAKTDVTAKIVGVLKGGWSLKVWDDDRVGDDVSTFGMEGDLYYDLTPRTRLSLILFRRIQDTTFTTTENVAFGSSFTTTGGTFEVRQAFAPRFDAYGNVGFTYNEYNEEGPVRKVREDYLFQGSVGLDYRIWKWITLGALYNFLNNDSNFDEEDYTENRVMIYGSFGL